MLCLLAVALAAGCTEDTSTRQGAAPVQLVNVTHEPTNQTFITTAEEEVAEFLSRENLRATYISGNINSRLKEPAGPTPDGYLDVDILNTPGQPGANNEFQVEIDITDITIEPIRQQRVIGGQWQPRTSDDDRRSISLNYQDEPLTQVIQGVFGGILSVNYIISESVGGTVTFRSEQKFSRTQLIQVMADILASRGYLVQYFNSVYYIGLPEELDQLTGLRGRTALENDDEYVIELRNAPPENIAAIASALIPPGNTVTAIPDTTNLLVRGSPAQFQSIADLVRSLAGNGRDKNVLAIIPLRKGAPALIAEQISAIYDARNLGNVLFLPLEQRQGLLVVGNSQSDINTARNLIRGLDVSLQDPPKLRVIQLTHLNAAEMAEQIGQIYSVAVSPAPATSAAGAPEQSSIRQAASELANPASSNNSNNSNNVNQVEGGDSLPVPSILRNNTAEQSTASPGAARAPQSASSLVSAGNGGGGAGAEVTIAADERNNSLLVRSSYEQFKRISDAVKVLDVPLSQVVIEATIVEVLINDGLQYGVQSFLNSNTNVFRTSSATGPADPGGAGFVAVLNGKIRLGGRSIDNVLVALQSVSDVKVISSPYMTVTNGSTSRLSVGDQIPFVTASQSSSSSGTVTVTQETETRDIGVILEVTPTIAPDNSVVLDVVQEVSSSANVATVAGENPTISQRRLQSQVTVESGGTILLGGLIQERSNITQTGVPVLSKIPLIGEAFKQTSDTQQRTELLVLITPRVVRNSSQIHDITNQLKWLLTTD